MRHPIHRVDRFVIAGAYTLVVTFVDGTEQRIDFQPVLRGPLLGPLRDLATFNAVRPGRRRRHPRLAQRGGLRSRHTP